MPQYYSKSGADEPVDSRKETHRIGDAHLEDERLDVRALAFLNQAPGWIKSHYQSRLKEVAGMPLQG